jgi:hypothetical protein
MVVLVLVLVDMLLMYVLLFVMSPTTIVPSPIDIRAVRAFASAPFMPALPP